MKRYFVYTYILSSMTEWHLDKLCSTRYWHKVHLNEILFCCNNKFIICESLCIPFCRVCTFEGQKHMFCLCLVLSICFYSLTYLVFNHYTLGVSFGDCVLRFPYSVFPSSQAMQYLCSIWYLLYFHTLSSWLI